MSYFNNQNKVSTVNSTEILLASGATYTGTFEQNNLPNMGVSCISNIAGTLYFDFSVDGTNVNTFPVAGFSVAAGIHEFHTAVKLGRYFRIRFIMDAGTQTYFRLYTYYGDGFVPSVSPLNQSASVDQDAIFTRSVMMGLTQGGIYKNVPVSSQGRIQMDIPFTAFGEIQVAEKTPQVQIKFAQGLNAAIVQKLYNKTGSVVTTSNGLCTVHTPATAEAFSQIRSLDVIRYGAGQGMSAKFTAAFTTGVALSSQLAGPGDDDEMLGFGYNGTTFGIMHKNFGELEVRTITFTAGGDAGGGTFTLTIDGTAVTITVPPNATIADVCALVVAAFDDLYNAGRGWEVFTSNSKTVSLISLVAENADGTFSFTDVNSGVTAGTFTQATTALLGVLPTETFIAQTTWNIDKMDGTGVSGMTLDPTKLNVFDIAFQYLGAGNLFFSIENPATGRLEPVHMIETAGTLTVPTFRNPSFHLNIIAKTETSYAGGVLDITTASMGGFIDGKETTEGVRHEVDATVSTNGTTEVVNLVVHNNTQFNGTRNKVVSYIDHLTIINESTKSIRLDIYKNPTHINSGVNLTPVDGTSVMSYGAGSGTRTGGNKLLAVSVAQSNSKDLVIGHLGIKIRPTETLVFVVTKSSGGADGLVTIGTSWLERI